MDVFPGIKVNKIYAGNYERHLGIRYSLDRSQDSLPIVYYFTKPNAWEKPYPILILCDGSDNKENIRSVLYIHNHPVLESLRSLPVGLLTVEKWGVDGDQIYEEEFWKHYTRSQRLEDHLKVIQELEAHPPDGWNHQLIFMGVSEGGPLVTDLSIICPRVLATVNFVGAGDFGWADEFWNFFQHMKKDSFWLRCYDAIPRWLPFSWDMPSSREEYDVLVQYIIDHPDPHQWLGGMTYLYNADAFQKAPIDYKKIKSPFLVVTGTEDSIIESSDLFVAKAKEAGAPVTYFRIDGMDHWIRKRPDVIHKAVEWLKMQLEDGGNDEDGF